MINNTFKPAIAKVGGPWDGANPKTWPGVGGTPGTTNYYDYNTGPSLPDPESTPLTHYNSETPKTGMSGGRKRKGKTTKRKSKTTKRKSKTTKRKSKTTKRKSKTTKRKSKTTKRKSKTTKRKSKTTKRKSKTTKRKSKTTKRKSKTTKRKSKTTKRKSKTTKRKSKTTKRGGGSHGNTIVPQPVVNLGRTVTYQGKNLWNSFVGNSPAINPDPLVQPIVK